METAKETLMYRSVLTFNLNTDMTYYVIAMDVNRPLL